MANPFRNFNINTGVGLGIFSGGVPRANLVGWYRADGTNYQDSARTTPVTANGQPVGSLTDYSGNGNHASASGATRPTYTASGQFGRPTLTFNGSNWMNATPGSLNRSTVAFAGILRVGGYVAGTAYALASGESNFLNAYFNPFQLFLGTGNVVLGPNIPTDQAAVGFQTHSGTTTDSFVNDQLYTGTSNAVSSQAFSNIEIGGTGGSPGMTGTISELLVYSAPLSVANWAALQAYLKGRNTPTNIGAGVKLVVADGNSLESGYPLSYANSWPGQATSLTSAGYVIFNQGWPGQTTPQMTSGGVARVDIFYSAAHAKNIMVGWEGRNDYFNGGGSAATLFAHILTWVQARQAVGWKVVVLTCLPSGSDVTWDGTVMPALNTLIKNSAATYGYTVADVQGNANLQDETNTTYFQADKVHLTAAGEGVVAGIVSTAVLSL